VDPDGANATAVGSVALAGGFASSAFGYSSIAYSNYSTAIGQNAVTTSTNQIRLGTSSDHVSIPGQLRVDGSSTNLTLRGTNIINGRVDFTSRANAGLVNGANAGIVLGTNVYVRLSGATTVAGISGFAAEQDGSFHIVQFTGAITNVIINEVNSTDIATDGTAANRIVTGTGTNFYATNTPLVIPFVYDGTASRWRMMNFLR
jgi:hypothetical protein